MNDRTAIGSNNPPAHEMFSMALDDVYVEAKNFLDGAAIDTKEQADAIGVILSTARRIRRDADTKRAEEKRPHDEAGKAVQATWRPLLERADNIIAAAQKPLTAYLEAEERRQREEAAKAREDALRAQQEAIAAARQAEGNLEAIEEANALQTSADKAMKEAAKSEKVKPQASGFGRAVGLRSYQVVDVTDRALLLRHVKATDPEALTAFLAEYARKALPAQLPGVTIRTEKRAA